MAFPIRDIIRKYDRGLFSCQGTRVNRRRRRAVSTQMGGGRIMAYIERHDWTEHSARLRPNEPTIRPDLKAKLARLAAADDRDLASYLEIVLEEHIERTSRT
jgi:hypothetical protein